MLRATKQPTVIKTPLWIEFEGGKRSIDQILYAKLTRNMDFMPTTTINKPAGADVSARKEAAAALFREMKLDSKKPVGNDITTTTTSSSNYKGLPDFAWDAMPLPHPVEKRSVGSDMLDHRYHVVYKHK